ncbi:MAG: tetratricopeptide repeat protein [Chloroflexi bacterium]|nr:tetratricopeptide repeat protein [Chloroflexota bacterium]
MNIDIISRVAWLLIGAFPLILLYANVVIISGKNRSLWWIIPSWILIGLPLVLPNESVPRCDKAITKYTKIIETDPRNAVAYNARAEAYINKGEYTKAIVDCTKAIEFDPKSAQAYMNRGIAHTKLGEIDSAQVDFKKAKELGYKV